MSLFPILQNYLKITMTKTDGRWIEDTPVPATFKGTIQPMTGREIEALNINRETQGMVNVFTITEFNIAKEGDNKPGDRVIHDGGEWQIIDKKKYNSNIINHNQYTAEYFQEAS